jgi:hypothetical protein
MLQLSETEILITFTICFQNFIILKHLNYSRSTLNRNHKYFFEIL